MCTGHLNQPSTSHLELYVRQTTTVWSVMADNSNTSPASSPLHHSSHGNSWISQSGLPFFLPASPAEYPVDPGLLPIAFRPGSESSSESDIGIANDPGSNTINVAVSGPGPAGKNGNGKEKREEKVRFDFDLFFFVLFLFCDKRKNLT
jgi:hypothetical protein